MSLFFYFTPCGFVGAAAQHQHFIWLLVRWIQWKDVLSGCGDLGRGQLFHTNNIIIDRQVIFDRAKFWYLHPEPLGHNLNAPVWIKLVTDKLQVALSVCYPGDDQTVWWRQKRNREPFQLGWGQRAVSLSRKQTRQKVMWWEEKHCLGWFKLANNELFIHRINK